MDKGYRKHIAVSKIERIWLGCKGRKIARNLRQTAASHIIQRNTRMFLGKLEFQRRFKARAAIKIQQYLRGLLAVKIANQLNENKIKAAKVFLAIKL
jgi:hypothetical protein